MSFRNPNNKTQETDVIKSTLLFQPNEDKALHQERLKKVHKELLEKTNKIYEAAENKSAKVNHAIKKNQVIAAQMHQDTPAHPGDMKVYAKSAAEISDSIAKSNHANKVNHKPAAAAAEDQTNQIAAAQSHRGLRK